MHQALTQLKRQVRLVLTDSTGATGQAMIRALGAGARDPLKLAELRTPAWKAAPQQIANALSGTWQAAHRLRRKHALKRFADSTVKIREGAAERARMVTAMESRGAPDAPRPA